MQAKVSSRSSSISTTGSTCSNISVRSKDDSKEAFGDFFGSKSSGLGSERRSSSICAENLEEVLESTSNCIPSEPPEAVSPLLSPDSCLEDESILEEPNLCIECATRAAVKAGGEMEGKNESLEGIESNRSKTEVSSNESVERETEDIIKVEDHSIEVSPTLRISSDKLESLLGSLEQDKHYPSLSTSPHHPNISTSPHHPNRPTSPNHPNPLRLSGRVSIASSSPSRQADKSPSRLRKTSSLKSSRSKQPPGRSVR